MKLITGKPWSWFHSTTLAPQVRVECLFFGFFINLLHNSTLTLLKAHPHLYTNANKACGTEANANECQKVACLAFATQANEEVFRWSFCWLPEWMYIHHYDYKRIFLWSTDSRRTVFACSLNICHISEWRWMLFAYTSTLCVFAFVLHLCTDG